MNFVGQMSDPIRTISCIFVLTYQSRFVWRGVYLERDKNNVGKSRGHILASGEAYFRKREQTLTLEVKLPLCGLCCALQALL